MLLIHSRLSIVPETAVAPARALLGSRSSTHATTCRDIHRFMDSWYEDPDKVRAYIGMPANDSLASASSSEVCHYFIQLL